MAEEGEQMLTRYLPADGGAGPAAGCRSKRDRSLQINLVSLLLNSLWHLYFMFEFGNDFNGPEADAYSVADGQEGEDAQHLVPPQREKTETQGKIEIESKDSNFCNMQINLVGSKHPWSLSSRPTVL